jgi:transposase
VGRKLQESAQRGDDASSDRALRHDTKKKTLYASERNAVARTKWREEVQPIPAEQIVVIDETSTTLNMTRRYARAPHDQRAYGYVPRNYGKRTTLIASMTTEGMGPAMLLEGASETAAFTVYIRDCLCPSLKTGQTVLMDNLSSHKAPAIREYIEAAQCQLLFLPTYSPDFSPIEPAFAKLKEYLRAVGARTQDALDKAIAQGLDAITAHDAQGWVRHSGYRTSVAS